MPARKYNPKRIRGSWTGEINGRKFAVQFRGYMDGTFLSAKYDSDAVTEHEGSDGDVTIVLNPGRKATLVVTLVQGSETNDELSLLQPDPDRDLLPTGVLAFEDLNGETVVECEEGWIRTVAEVTFGNDVQGREWTFGMAGAKIHVGGSAAA